MSSILIYGGGTIMPVRSHLALCAPAFGTTAKLLGEQLQSRGQVSFAVNLTRMADPRSELVTNDDVWAHLQQALLRPETAVIIFNVALCDFAGQIGEVPSGFHAPRLSSREQAPLISLTPTDKLLARIKALRPDVFLVGFKTTANQPEQEQVRLAIRQIDETGTDLVFANDTVTRNNLLVSEEGIVCGTREDLLEKLIDSAVTYAQRGASTNA